MWLAPYWVNYHCEHHMFTQIPCWNLPLAHRMLHAKGVTARMNTAPSYAALLRQAAPA
jgi:fatty acid desaturase